MTSRNRTFARQEVFPSYIFNRLQDRLGPLDNLRLRRVNATTIEVVAGAGDDATVLSIENRWRWIEAPVQRAAPGGSAGVFAIFAVAADNDVVTSPEANTDETSYDFDLRIVADGETPALLVGEVEIFRRIGRLTWDGAAITELRQEIGIVGGPQIADDVVSRMFVTGTLVDRPAAAAANAGLTYRDEHSTLWRSDGTAWLLSGGKAPHVDLRLGAASVIASGDGTAPTALAWTIELEDVWSMHASSATDIVIPYDGIWSGAMYVETAAPNTDGDRHGRIDSIGAGAQLLGVEIRRPSAGTGGGFDRFTVAMLPVRLAAGTVVRGSFSQSSGADVGLSSGTRIALQMLSS